MPSEEENRSIVWVVLVLGVLGFFVMTFFGEETWDRVLDFITNLVESK